MPVVPRRAVRSVGRGTERFELAQNHQGDNARAVRWALPDVEAPPAEMDGLDELGAKAAVGETLFRLHAARALQRLGHVGRDRPGIEGVRAARGDRAQRAGERRLDEKLA